MSRSDGPLPRDYEYRCKTADIADGLAEAADPEEAGHLRAIISLLPDCGIGTPGGRNPTLRADMAAAQLSTDGPLLRAGAAAAGLCYGPACVAARFHRGARPDRVMFTSFYFRIDAGTAPSCPCVSMCVNYARLLMY